MSGPAPGPTGSAGEVERRYARVLEIGIAVTLPLLLLTFGLYTAGIIEPAVPVTELPRYWGLSAHEYLTAINTDHLRRADQLTGWSWTAELHHGDFLTFIPIAALPALTMVCYLAIIPPLLRRHDRLYAGMAVLELLILALAASGLIRAAGH